MKGRVATGLILMLFLFLPALHAEDTMKVGRFGKIHLYRNSPSPAHVIVFVGGDGGWNKGAVIIATQLSTMDSLVIGADMVHYFREMESANDRCSDPAADLHDLAQTVEKKMQYPAYVKPVLVGYSSGATLVYAALVQSQPGTFLGAFSMGFCPDLPLTKPVCKGYDLRYGFLPKGKGYSFLPADRLQESWVAVQGDLDKECLPSATELYTKQVNTGNFVMTPGVGHGFYFPEHWGREFQQAFNRIVSHQQTADTHLVSSRPAH